LSDAHNTWDQFLACHPHVNSAGMLACQSMIPIKLQCECGQRFAFEVEPVHGRMPTPVNCPACDADNTAAANAVLAQSAEPRPEATPAATPAGPGPLRVTLPPRAESPAKLAVPAP